MTFAINTISASSALTMSSREIADLTGKLHKNVLADIREMFDVLEMTSAEFSANLPDSYGRPQAGFNLPKDLTITLISGYNVKMRHAITKRWMELEAATAPALPASYLDALRAHLASEEKAAALALENTKQAEVIAIAAPKAEFYDELVDTAEVYNPTQIANLLGNAKYKSAQKVNELLAVLGWQYKRGSHWVATAEAVAKGLMQAKVYTNGDTGFSGTHVRVTVSGLDTLNKHFSM